MMRTVAEHRTISWLGIGFSAPWLVFLVFPLTPFLEASHLRPGQLIYAAACLGVFAVADVSAYAAPWLVKTANPLTRKIIWTVLLLLPAAALIPAYPQSITTYCFGLSMYFMALWLFDDDLPYSLRVRAAAGIGLGLWVFYLVGDGFPIDFARKANLSAALGLPIIAMLGFSYMIQVGKNADKAKADLKIVHERERIARDVHDVLGHSLTVITLKADLASKLITADPNRAAAELQAIAQLSRASLAEVRSTVTRLRIPDFSGEIQASGRALHTAAITATLPDAASAVSVAGVNASLFSWVLREATTNVVRHSGASVCEVRLSPTGLEILDNGTGIPAGCAGSGGLAGMVQRVEAAGGMLIIEGASAGWLAAHPGGGKAGRQGTRIRVSMDGSTTEIVQPGEPTKPAANAQQKEHHD